jgi:EpsI family protein
MNHIKIMLGKINKYPAIVLLLILLLFALFIYQSTVLSLFNLWVISKDATYGHGLLLIIISAYLFYQRLYTSRNLLDYKFSLTGLTFLVAASIIWYLSGLANVTSLQQSMFVAILILLIWSLLGYQNSLRLAFPILLLFFAIPVWEIFNQGWLQDVTATIVTRLIQMSTILAYHEGARIFLPAGTFYVTPDCSGMRFLLVAIPIAMIYADQHQFRLFVAIPYILVAIVFTFFINLLRIYIVVLAGQFTDMQSFLVNDHLAFGWVLFGIGIVIFILLSNKITNNFPNIKMRSSFVSDVQNEINYNHQKQNRVFRLALVIVGLSIGPMMTILHNDKTISQTGNLVIPSIFNNWKVVDNRKFSYRPNFIPADAVYEGVYINQNGKSIYCYVGYFWSQQQDRELINEMSRVYDENNWILIGSQKYNTHVAGEMIGLKEAVVRSKTGQEKLIWYWYTIADRRISRNIIAKLFQVWGELVGQRGAAVTLISTDINVSRAKSRETLNGFLEESIYGLEEAINNASAIDDGNSP